MRVEVCIAFRREIEVEAQTPEAAEQQALRWLDSHAPEVIDGAQIVMEVQK